MFDTQQSGSVDIHQFSKLFEYINQWLNIFRTYDRNGSGQIDDQELNQGRLQPPLVPLTFGATETMSLHL